MEEKHSMLGSQELRPEVRFLVSQCAVNVIDADH